MKRSFDTRQCGSFAPTSFTPSHSGPAARAVLWQDDWPPQSEVPHAGETVWVTHGPYVHLAEAVVSTGIPVKNDLRWLIHVRPVDRSSDVAVPLAEVSRTPPTQRAEGKVVGTIMVGPNVKSVQVDGFAAGTYKIIEEDA